MVTQLKGLVQTSDDLQLQVNTPEANAATQEDADLLRTRMQANLTAMGEIAGDGGMIDLLNSEMQALSDQTQSNTHMTQAIQFRVISVLI